MCYSACRVQARSEILAYCKSFSGGFVFIAKLNIYLAISLSSKGFLCQIYLRNNKTIFVCIDIITRTDRDISKAN